MTEQEWSQSDNPDRMLAFLRGPEQPSRQGVLGWLGLRRAPPLTPPPHPPSKRKLRLLACACCRRIEILFVDEYCQQAVAVSERFADGLATEQELAAAQAVAHDAAGILIQGPATHESSTSAFGTLPVGWKGRAWAERAAAEAASLDTPEAAVHSAVSAAVEAGSVQAPHAWAARLGSVALADLMRDLFGPLLFRSLSVPSSWLLPRVVALAGVAYEERAVPGGALDNARLAVLADALEEAGCDNEEILTHLRGRADHVRGCFVLDLLLGRS